MNEIILLSITALSLGFIHTLLGPDHYLPFIVLSRARNWTTTKTMWLTFVSGVGHVGGSVVIGVVGIAIGVSVNRLEIIESARGNIVGWLIIVFGVGYSFYGLVKLLKHDFNHRHPFRFLPSWLKTINNSSNGLESNEENTKLTPWILFIIFVFGPCEVLIPMLIFPASEMDGVSILLVSLSFGFATVGTMMMVVYWGHKGISLLKIKTLNKYLHLIAGGIILLSGVGMVFLGW